MKSEPLHFERTREYPMTPSDVWRLLGDTNHMNRILRMPAVDFSAPGQAGIPFVRAARARARGAAAVRWKEYPFEWVRERRYSVRREFESGPLRTAVIGCELQPLPMGQAGENGGVRVKVFADVTPATLLGRLLARGMGRTLVEGMIRYCDQSLRRREERRVDPLPVPATTPAVDASRLDHVLQRLRDAPVEARLVEALRQRVVEGTDAQVLRVRPYAVADEWGVDRRELLRLFLHATRAGLFDLRWELMCPVCRVPKAEHGGLADLPERFHCETCGVDWESNFDERVELRFSVNPSVREAADQVYCIGGPLQTPYIVAQQYLGPRETRRVELPLEGALEVRGVGMGSGIALPPVTTATGVVDLRFAQGSWSAMPQEKESNVAAVRPPGPGADPFPAGGGELALRLVNDADANVLAVVERIDWKAPAVTAAEVTTIQEFRDLFSSEVLAPGHEVGVRNLALLFSDLKGSTALYEEVGDAPAYGRVNRHFEFLRGKIAARRGAVVKTIGDAVMGAFLSVDDALAAAIEMQLEIAAWCAGQGVEPPFVLKLGVHHGPVIAVNANERLDYFGGTVNVAARLGRESAGGDVVVLASVAGEPGVRELLAERASEVERFTAELRGIEGTLELVRLRPALAR